MKKWITLMMAIALVIGVSACGPTGGTTEEAPATGAPAEDAGAAEEAPAE